MSFDFKFFQDNPMAAGEFWMRNHSVKNGVPFPGFSPSSPCDEDTTPKKVSLEKSDMTDFRYLFYISGPMTGIKDWNYPLFHEVAAQLRSKLLLDGLDDADSLVFNPAEMFDGETDLPRHAYFLEDISALTESMRILLLPGWENSAGAKLEVAVAKEIGLDFYRLVVDGNKPFRFEVMETPPEISIDCQKSDKPMSLEAKRFHDLFQKPLDRYVNEQISERLSKYQDPEYDPVKEAEANANAIGGCLVPLEFSKKLFGVPSDPETKEELNGCKTDKEANPPANSGIRTFETGAVRNSDTDKYRFDLISPIGLRAVAKTAAEGSVTYGDYNWEKGMPAHDLLNHASAHLNNFYAGDRSEDHLAHAAWNIMAAIHSLELWPHLNDNKLRGPNCSHPNHKVE
ncbi:MAG: DUF4406 domain-containing protein [Patescibacteria group bacterium]|nr:DUF4406 domain-containing protein [Patescibacteria group bacterium]